MGVLDNLEPIKVFYYFEEISKIPRGSGNEKEISDYIVNFARDRNLEYHQDKFYNVILKKKATKGYEKSEPVIIQAHIDMVCEKNNDISHNFLLDEIEINFKDDFIFANGTTLGADNGIGVAYILALLDSYDIEHPFLECIFTTCEESGLEGAKNIDISIIKGKRLINLDSEEDNKIVVSCCGGMRVTTNLPIHFESIDRTLKPFFIKIRGLKGGHSGSDIHLQRANANKLMGRILEYINDINYRLAYINGGLMDNAITRESDAIIFINEDDFKKINLKIQNIKNIFINEYKYIEEDIDIIFESLNYEIEYKAFDEKTKNAVKNILIMIPYGVISMNIAIKGVVESSSNIGILKTDEQYVKFISAIRSSVDSKKEYIFNLINILGNIFDAKSIITSSYPSWEFNENSKLLDITKNVFFNYYNKEPIIEAIHAGLECGIFAEKLEGIDMISIGPNLFDVHTPDEKLSISSTKKVWEFLKLLLRNLK